MAVDILTSRRVAGVVPAEEVLFDSFVSAYEASSAREKKDLIFLVPQQMSYQTERELISRLKRPGLFGARVESFKTLGRNILKEAGAKAMNVLDEHGRIMLVQKAASDVASQLSVYRGAQKRNGFSQEAARQIRLFQENEIGSQALEAAAEQAGSKILGQKLSDLSRIYTRYQELLGEERVDEEGEKHRILDAIEQSGCFEGKHLFVMGFTTLSNLDLEILAAIAEQCASMEISFLTDPDPNVSDSSAFAETNVALERMKRAFRDREIDVRSTHRPLPMADPVLTNLEKNALSYHPGKLGSAAGKITQVHAQDLWDEASSVAARCALMIRDGMDPEDLLVTVPDLGSCASTYLRAFEEVDVACFIDQREPVLQSAFIEMILSALDTIRSGYRREEILTYLKSPFSGLSADEADELENFVIETGITEKFWRTGFVNETIKSRLGEGQEDRLARMEDLRKRIVTPLKKISTRKTSYRERCAQIRAYLEEAGVDETLEERLSAFREDGRLDDEMKYRQIREIFEEVLEQVENSLDESESTLAEYIEVLRGGLSSYSIGLIPESDSLVEITDVHRGRKRNAKVVFITGLNEGVFPRADNPGGLFSDFELESLKGVLDISGFNRGTDDEYAFYNALTKASDRLILSECQSGSASGRQNPSVFLERITGMLDVSEEAPLTPMQRLCVERPEHVLSAYLSDRKRGEGMDNAVYEAALAYLALQDDRESRRLLHKMLAGERFEGADDQVSVQTVRDLYGKDSLNVSVSRLENFARCPFSHYLNKGLRLQQREEYEVRALDTGNLMHAFFESFYQTLNLDQDPNAEQTLENLTNPESGELKATMDAVFAKEALEHYRPRYFSTNAATYTYGKLTKMLQAAAKVQAAQLLRSGFRPIRFEEKIDRVIREASDGEEEIRLIGRIDRIDAKDDAVSVVDYKSGQGGTLSYTEIVGGVNLQLLVYLYEALLMSAEALGEEIRPGGAFYSYLDLKTLKDGKSWVDAKDVRLTGYGDKDLCADLQKEVLDIGRDRALDREELIALVNFAEKQVRDLAEEMLSGSTDIRPYQSSKADACAFCPYGHICQIDLTPDRVNRAEAVSASEMMDILHEELDHHDSEDATEQKTNERGETDGTEVHA